MTKRRYSVLKSSGCCSGASGTTIWVQNIGDKKWCSWCGEGKNPKGWKKEWDNLDKDMNSETHRAGVVQ